LSWLWSARLFGSWSIEHGGDLTSTRILQRLTNPSCQTIAYRDVRSMRRKISSTRSMAQQATHRCMSFRILRGRRRCTADLDLLVWLRGDSIHSIQKCSSRPPGKWDGCCILFLIAFSFLEYPVPCFTKRLDFVTEYTETCSVYTPRFHCISVKM
jgi:hypothetical protein